METPPSAGVSSEQWAEILDAYGDRCAYCSAEDGPLTRDHFVPIALGGLDEPGNVVPACAACNYSKGAKPFEEWCARGTSAKRARGRSGAVWRESDYRAHGYKTIKLRLPADVFNKFSALARELEVSRAEALGALLEK